MRVDFLPVLHIVYVVYSCDFCPHCFPRNPCNCLHLSFSPPPHSSFKFSMFQNFMFVRCTYCELCLKRIGARVRRHFFYFYVVFVCNDHSTPVANVYKTTRSFFLSCQPVRLMIAHNIVLLVSFFVWSCYFVWCMFAGVFLFVRFLVFVDFVSKESLPPSLLFPFSCLLISTDVPLYSKLRLVLFHCTLFKFIVGYRFSCIVVQLLFVFCIVWSLCGRIYTLHQPQQPISTKIQNAEPVPLLFDEQKKYWTNTYKMKMNRRWNDSLEEGRREIG